MAEPASATPPATSGGLTKDEVKALLGEALREALTPVGEVLKTLTGEQAALKESVAKIGSVKADDVAKLVSDQLTASQKAAGEAAAKEAQTKAAQEALKSEREAFAKENLKGVPALYQGGLGDDKTKWAEAAKTIRGAFAEDLKGAGIKAADLGGSAGGTAETGQKAESGFLKMAPGIAGGAAATTTTTAAAK